MSQDQKYYELVEAATSEEEVEDSTPADSSEDEVLTETARASTLDYTSSKCSKRQVIHVQCRGLECGVRPRLAAPRARYDIANFFYVSKISLSKCRSSCQRKDFALAFLFTCCPVLLEIFEKDRGRHQLSTGCLAVASSFVQRRRFPVRSHFDFRPLASLSRPLFLPVSATIKVIPLSNGLTTSGVIIVLRMTTGLPD